MDPIRFASVLADPALHDVAREELKTMQGAMRDAGDDWLKAFRTTALLSAVFELGAGAVVSQASFAGIEVKDLSLILRVLPAFIAFSAMRAHAHYARQLILLQCFRAVYRRLYPTLYAHDWDVMYVTPALSAEMVLSAPGRGAAGGIGKVARGIAMFGIVLALFLPWTYLLRAYTICFNKFGLGNAVVWTSLGFAVLFFLQMAVNHATTIRKVQTK
ncbi:MAG: hypothetical protein AB1762_13735 [Gemmatimonadota bacterium]